MGDLYQRRTRMLILRSALIKHNVLVRNTNRGQTAQAQQGEGAQQQQQQQQQQTLDIGLGNNMQH